MCQNIDESHYKSTPYKVESLGNGCGIVINLLLIIKELASYIYIYIYIYIKIQTREEKEKWRSEQKQ
jgi:hypothetical protein